MKPVQKSIYFSPTMLFFFEDISKEKKCSFNEAVVKFLEEAVSKQENSRTIQEVLKGQEEVKDYISQVAGMLAEIIEEKK